MLRILDPGQDEALSDTIGYPRLLDLPHDNRPRLPATLAAQATAPRLGREIQPPLGQVSERSILASPLRALDDDIDEEAADDIPAKELDIPDNGDELVEPIPTPLEDIPIEEIPEEEEDDPFDDFDDGPGR